MIKPNARLEAELRSQAEAASPNEGCGIILGRATIATDRAPDGLEKKETARLILIANAKNSLEQRNRFLITDDELMRAELTACREKLDVIGFYHSHPDHPAAPSQFDLDHTLPFYSYLIVTVARGKSEALPSWVVENDRSRFNPEIIEGE